MKKWKSFEVNHKEVGKRFFELRHNHNLKQAPVSEILGITRAAYSQIERGKYGAGIKVLANAVRYYSSLGENVSVDWLIGLSDKPNLKIEIEAKQLKSENSLLKDRVDSLNKRIDQILNLADKQ